MRNILELLTYLKRLENQGNTETAEKKFEEAAENWNTDPTSVADAAEKYFMPGKDILQRLKPCKTDNPVQLVLSGIAAGDIAGEPYEGSCAKDMYPDLDYRDLPFFRPGSHFTDDTVMSFACRKAAEANKKYGSDGKAAVLMYEANLRGFARKFPMAGYGAHFYDWAVLGVNSTEYRSYGNGGAMRSGVIGAVFDDVKTVIRQAVYSALPSHSHPEGIKGAVVTAVSVYLALHQIPKEDILQYMSSFYAVPFRDKPLWSPMPDMPIEELIDHGWQCTSVTTQITMPEVIINLRNSDSYETCIRNVFRYPCDSDTIGAISGGIAAALYGNTDVAGMDTEKELREKLKELESFGGKL